MSFINEISVRDANEHDYVHPMQFIGRINSYLDPWRIMDFDLKNAKSGQMILKLDIIDTTRLGATRIDKVTGDAEEAYGIKVDFPIHGILPTKDELEILIESIRQDLGLKGSPTIYMGK